MQKNYARRFPSHHSNPESKMVLMTEEDLLEFITQVIDSYKEELNGLEAKKAAYVTSQEAMKLLSISSRTTLSKLRDAGLISVARVSRKLILYSRESIEMYLAELESKSQW